MKKLTLGDTDCQLSSEGLHVSPIRNPCVRLAIRSGNEFETLLALARGTTKAQAIDALGSQAFDELRESGLLVDSEECRSATQVSAWQDGFRLLGYQISNLLSNLDSNQTDAADIRGMLGHLTSLRERLEALVTARQSADLGYFRDVYGPPGDYKILLGAGAATEPGWIGFDMLEGRRVDLRLRLPLPDHSVSAAYGSFVLEHLIFPSEAMSLFLELKRVMRPGACLRLVVPHGREIVKSHIHGSQLQEVRAIHDRWVGAFENLQTPFASMLFYLGAGPGLDLGPRTHKFSYDAKTLERLAGSSGFSAFKESYFEDESSELSWLDQRSQSIEGIPEKLCLFVDILP